ncbi:MAG: biopolymer transporter ExbD [Chitinophagales bacterium]|nr:biopolymer transporter ExbD [Chitinophagales bacterium]MCZ2392945.1 biopolymer transporter ExbD [Chitinophagales bacterium]
MPKVKIPKKSVVVDMTAMCDVSFLLLAFFILTAKFRPTESVMVDTPTSRATEQVKEDIITITVNKEGGAYLTLFSTRRVPTLNSLIERYGEKYPSLRTLTKDQINNFGNVETFGFNINQLPSLLSKSKDELIQIEKNMPGIPIDSVDSQIGDWVNAARSTGLEAGIEVPIAIKGDKSTNVVAVKDIIEALRKREIYRFNLITSLEGRVD